LEPLSAEYVDERQTSPLIQEYQVVRNPAEIADAFGTYLGCLGSGP
jgi:hypothetical protein